MLSSDKITDILNGTIYSVKNILPFDVSVEKPSLFAQPFSQHAIGVLIGMTGDIRGRIIIDGNETIFGRIGEAMYGMFLADEMLQSFAGELGNMIVGKLTTHLSSRGFTIDITPPVILVGQSKVYGFEEAFRIPVEIEKIGYLSIILMAEM
ncbi:chemotaxis protein CheX [Bacillaceae bacterium Marseille-Q3522]|nr:chemotaxis protein CheX [Bacillaceae bacterium Marseille-Q3522]